MLPEARVAGRVRSSGPLTQVAAEPPETAPAAVALRVRRLVASVVSGAERSNRPGAGLGGAGGRVQCLVQ